MPQPVHKGGPRVNLVMLNPNKFGGTISYTAHLYHVLRLVGCDTHIYRLGKTVSKPKDFGYGCLHQTVPLDYIKAQPGHTLIAACIGKEFEAPTLELLAAGARLTVHDPNDIGYFTDLDFTKSKKLVIIRPNNTSICPKATFIPHPFIRQYRKFLDDQPRPKWAVTLSRLGAIKRTKWIVEANRELPKGRQIWLRGYDDRFFTYNAFIRSGKYKEFKQDSELPEDQRRTFGKDLGEAQKIAKGCTWLVDLTEIKGDGGGTQYTLLEAIDAGCALMLNQAWCTKGGLWKPGDNCAAVSDKDDLVRKLSMTWDPTRIQGLARRAYKILDNHKPADIAEQYLDFFKRTH